MVEEHHRLKGHEFEQTLGDSEAQGSLVCSSPWGRREADTTWRLNNKALLEMLYMHVAVYSFNDSIRCEFYN